MPSMCRDAGIRHKKECTDPIRLTSLARCLRKCKSTPDLSFTAVSLLTKTLTARATRLETSTSKARLAADKEAFRTTTVNKRRRETAPKNATEFMRQTIRNRHNKNAQHKNRGERSKEATNTSTELLFSADVAAYQGRAVFQPRRQGSSWSNAPSLPQREGARACRGKGTVPVAAVDRPRTQRRARSAGARRRDTPTWPDETCEEERSSQPDHASDLRSRDSWNLEDDTDIRVLLDIEQPHTSNNTRTSTSNTTAGSSANPGSRCCSAKARPASCGRRDRLQAATTRAAAAAAPRDNRSNVFSAGGKGYCTPRPRTAAARSRISEAETSSSPSTPIGRSKKGRQPRGERERLSRGAGAEGPPRGERERLGRGVLYVDGAGGKLRGDRERLSRGGAYVDVAEGQLGGERERLGRGVVVNGVEIRPFEVTAMGRKVHPLDRAADRPERWLPAKTLNGLDRLQRSRMLANKRPEVTGPSVWARQKEGRQEGSPQRGHVPRGACARWLK